jgi:hypothetical protein
MDIQVSNVFKTRRGKKCINVDSYEYRTLKSGDTNKKCSVSVLVNKSI